MTGLAIALTGFLRVFGFVTDPWLPDSVIHRVEGEPARMGRALGDRDPTGLEPLKVVTWNIARGEEYDAILAVLRRLDADVLLLQEVDRFCRRTGYRDVARDLAVALDMNWVAAGEFQEIGEGRQDRPALHGQAILSKFPIEHADVLRFSAQDRWRWSINPAQPRRGGRIALQARTGGLLVYNTHIESGGRQSVKQKQIAEILAHQAVLAAQSMPVVIGGDFNNGPILHASMFGYLMKASFADGLGELGQRGPTSLGQLHPIDWIFVKNVKPVHGRVVDAASASDHSPLIAAVAFIGATVTPAKTPTPALVGAASR
jgi:endonuclease/exonuclease/phosphatase family metal-dependent hydrolase